MSCQQRARRDGYFATRVNWIVPIATNDGPWSCTPSSTSGGGVILPAALQAAPPTQPTRGAKGPSAAIPDSLALLGKLANAGRYHLATPNTEPRELNEYRIETFGLRNYFSVFLSSWFLSSCSVGVRKLDEEMYRPAVGISQHHPRADLAGIRPVRSKTANQRRSSLHELGVTE